MIPVIKWPGGKRREMQKIMSNLPEEFSYIVEPFFGGGAFSFHFIDEYNIIGSDIDLDLVKFYSLIYNQSFLNRVKRFSLWWDKDEKISEFPDKTLNLHWNDVKEANRKSIKHHFYYAARNKYNKLKIKDTYNEERTLLFFIMRELSFSSMFRFNSRGGFNVPYGGYAYNSKSFLNKYKLLLKLSKKELNIIQSDFHQIIEQYKYDNDALIFLDPPYDSVFKDYNSNSFGQRDQIRLRDSLMDSNAKILMIINDTPFIKSLYNDTNFSIESYEKKYSVNFKNRNKQTVGHLVIKNY